MIAVNFDNLLFLLLVAVAVLFQFLAKTAAKTGKDQTKRTETPQTPTPTRRPPTESDEDRIRKLLEALGQPPTSRPPPPVAPRTDIPPRPVAPVQPPNVTTFTSKTRKVAQARDNSERNSSAAAYQGSGENGSTCLRSSGRRVSDCAGADLQSACGNLRGCDADNC